MCLGVPGCVVEMQRVDDVLMGHVAFGNIRRQVCLEHVPDVQLGEYVLVHVGFALTKIDAAEAARLWEFLESFARVSEELDAETPA